MMEINEFIDRIKTLPQAKAKQQVKWYLLTFVGDVKKGDYLRNRFKREMREKVEKI